MKTDPLTPPHFWQRLWAILSGLYVEIGILLFCAIILLGTGKTSGPVFDTVGPDFLPTAVAVIVIVLVLLQVLVQVAQEIRSPSPPAGFDPRIALKVVIFVAVTIIFVALLAFGILPLYLASSCFMALATPLLSQQPGWRDAVYGAVAGLVLGIVLQYVFTQILYIDL